MASLLTFAALSLALFSSRCRLVSSFSRLFSRVLLKGGLAIRNTAPADAYTIPSALQCILQSANEPARQSLRLDVERRMHGIGIAVAELVAGGTALMQIPLLSWRFDRGRCAHSQARRDTMLSNKITSHCRLSIVQASVALSAPNAIVLAAPKPQLPCSIGNRDKSSIAIWRVSACNGTWVRKQSRLATAAPYC